MKIGRGVSLRSLGSQTLSCRTQHAARAKAPRSRIEQAQEQVDCRWTLSQGVILDGQPQEIISFSHGACSRCWEAAEASSTLRSFRLFSLLVRFAVWASIVGRRHHRNIHVVAGVGCCFACSQDRRCLHVFLRTHVLTWASACAHVLSTTARRPPPSHLLASEVVHIPYAELGAGGCIGHSSSNDLVAPQMR